MLWGFATFVKLLALTLFRSTGTPARITTKRFLVLSGFLPVLFFGQVMHWIGFLFDDVLFRGYRNVAIQQPVFVIGIPRSGTTLLHRVLAQDTDRFTSMKLWEIVVAPSITERKIWMAIGRVDALLGGLGRKLLVALDRRLFKPLDGIHNMSLFDYDEDDMLLIGVFASMYLYFPFPFRHALWKFVRFDEETPAAEKDRIMRFYKACVQRHLYYHGPRKRFLSKNPAFSPKIEAIRNHFPDASVICNMRSPYDTVPSLISALHVVWEIFDNDPQGDQFRDDVLELTYVWYRHPIQCSSAWPEDQFSFITYDVLTQDLNASVLDLYAQFEIEAGPKFADYLEREAEKVKAYSSSHEYSLDRYGLTPDDIYETFDYVFDHFGFERQAPATPERAGEQTVTH